MNTSRQTRQPLLSSQLAATYARLWSALRNVAGNQKTRPNVVLVVLAIAEGARDTASLEQMLLVHDSVVRRALADAYASGLVTGSAVDGGRPRQGVRTAVELTPAGKKLVVAVVSAVGEFGGTER